MKHSVLIVVAPFGFGPASKALIIGTALSDLSEVSFSADGDACGFIERHKLPSANCVNGRFSTAFSDHRKLRKFDLIISVNHDPAIHHVARLGLAERAVFVDSLFVWRAHSAPKALPRELSAYLIQDYPGTAAKMGHCKSEKIALTAPFIWPLAVGAIFRPRSGITLHLGGMVSPLATWESLAPVVLHIARQVGELAFRCGQKLTIIGSARLRELPLHREAMSVLGDVSPAESAHLIASSGLLVSTPGIGAVYEAISYGTPVVLLAAMNSTQLHHYSVLTQYGIQGAVHPELMTRLVAAAAKTGWEQQTRLCLRVLHDFPKQILSQLPQICEPFLGPGSDPQARDRYLADQHKLLGTLSMTDPIAFLRGLVEAKRPEA